VGLLEFQRNGHAQLRPAITRDDPVSGHAGRSIYRYSP
jgi:hypothetical protein